MWFSATNTSHPEAARAYGWMRFLQLDLFAQAVGMVNASDYLNPHLWTVVAMVLACKVVIIRATRAEPETSSLHGYGAAPAPRLAFCPASGNP